MTLIQLSQEYRASGEACRQRVKELNEILSTPGLSQGDRVRLERRICMLTSMARDAIATSKYLENYYGDNNDGKKSVCKRRRVSVLAEIPENDGKCGMWE